MNTYYVGWWNVENLFDVQNSPDRPAWLQNSLNKELEGWTEDVLDRKTQQLSKIISQMNNGQGPDILGVCEIENRNVLDRLINKLHTNLSNRKYAAAHHDMSDERGIDIAFIYDEQKFEPQEQFSRVILKRNATRDLFQVNFRNKDNWEKIVLIGNHWPARSGNEMITEPYRIMAAETLSYWLERIPIKMEDENIPILVMGDFNDEPFNRSLTQYALCTNCKPRVLKSNNPALFNPMYKFLGEGKGTIYYSQSPNVFDQFMVNKNLLNNANTFHLAENDERNYDVNIETFDEMKTDEDTIAPLRFGRPSSPSSFNENGFSDHYPISIRING